MRTATASVSAQTTPVVTLRGAGLSYSARPLWQDVDVTITPGEFVAVLGPNGSGKTSLVKVLLGLATLTAGTVQVCGAAPKRGSTQIGYIPQQKGFDRDVPIEGVDLVGLGLDGHRWGIGLPSSKRRRHIDAAVAAVGATSFAHSPVGHLSGGEQQRLRIAQALLGAPKLLLCDEPLLSLDLRHQREVVELIDAQRRAADIAVLFVTHEINPILPFVDRVLYLVGTRWVIGSPADVLTSSTLSELYRTDVEVLSAGGRVIIVGAPDSSLTERTDGQHRPAAGAQGRLL
ncbi:ABC transporter ATP-binding protein [Mycolicibacterium sp. CH28]|uniref:metal ABC transporter ATP-binding protein n=1 Tax=Mycolicibacterium sp. CH28 TaxID=2512237 RepID=UPI0010805126|nr:ABC transporter ATP-binding protein [Mycolicibacterium sp. CH28]TGD90341.1 ABC transporter ATP-binding protein [Mycolicibacterium sp. CH28]